MLDVKIHLSYYVVALYFQQRGLFAGSSFGYGILHKFWFSPIDAIQYV